MDEFIFLNEKRTVMKTTMLKILFLLYISLAVATSGMAQDETKLKSNDKESKYKSKDLKVKDKKDETKYKGDESKTKDKKGELKYKGDAMKVKDKKGEKKIKGKVTPMTKTMTERTETRMGKTEVRTREHMEPVVVEQPTPQPAVTPEVAVPPLPEPAAPKHVTRKTAYHRPAAHKTNTARKYIVRTKVVRDTVFVPSPPEQIVTKQTEYVHDTVTMTRVDTVLKIQNENTYTGYRVPRGNFKKVKLRRDKATDDVWMKRKEKDGKIKTEKIKE